MKLQKCLFLAFILSLSFVSCEKEEVSIKTTPETPDASKKAESFKELELEHTYSTPSEALDYEVADLQSMYFENGGLKSTNIDEEVYPTLEEIAAIVEENLSKYPNVYEMDSLDYSMVKSNFPNLSDEQIKENLDLIDNYYTKNLQYDLITGIIEQNEIKKSSRLKGGSYPGGLYSREFWYLIYRPKATASVKDAKDDAWDWTEDIYGKNNTYDKSDAYRHIAWSTLIAKYHADKKKDIGKGMKLAREFTNIHEEENRDVHGAPDWDCQMDYHNNWIGRDYFESIASIKRESRWWWVTDKKSLDCPMNAIIKVQILIKMRYDSKKVDKTKAAVDAVSKYKPVYFE